MEEKEQVEKLVAIPLREVSNFLHITAPKYKVREEHGGYGSYSWSRINLKLGHCF